MPRQRSHQSSAASLPGNHRTSTHCREIRSTCSSASGTIKTVETTIQALKANIKLDELDETLSVSSSHWDTDLEDGDDDVVKTKRSSEKERYKRICEDLGVTPVSRFGEEIGQEEVKISHRFLRGLGTKAIASVLKHNNSTSKVQLAFNELSSQGGVYIGKVLRTNKSLKELNLANNHISKEGIVSISSALAENTAIQQLNLSGNGLTDKDARILADAIENNTSLRHLNLSYNKFGELAGQYLGSALNYNNGIMELNLSWNHIRRKGARAIHQSLRYNDALEKLDLSWNGFDDFGTEDLADALKRNTSLIELNLSNNRLTDEGILKAAQGLDGNSTLEVLHLSHNSVVKRSKGVMRILEIIKKGKCSLKILGLLDVRIDTNCKTLLEACLKADKELQIEFGCKKRESFATKKIEVNPFDFLRDYIDKHKIHSSDLFKLLDVNCQFRDSLTTQEFVDGIKRLKVMNHFYIDKLVEMLDTDGDGEIDYSEFVKLS